MNRRELEETLTSVVEIAIKNSGFFCCQRSCFITKGLVCVDPVLEQIAPGMTFDLRYIIETNYDGVLLQGQVHERQNIVTIDNIILYPGFCRKGIGSSIVNQLHQRFPNHDFYGTGVLNHRFFRQHNYVPIPNRPGVSKLVRAA